MPVRNEERHLAESVSQVLSQDYPGGLELVLAVGPSKDKTAEIAERLAAADPRITVVANPSGQIPSALNAAIRAAHHDILVRVDGHAMLPPGYIATAVRTLAETGAVNVGGIMAARGITPFQRAVAWAMTSPAGVGSAKYHTGGGSGPAESVYLGTFRRSALEQAGGYDERYLRAEDWELNHRIRDAGGLIWFQPELRVTYRPRATVAALGSQYFHYGRWRHVVARMHAGTINPRYLAPPVVVGAIAAGTLAGVAGLISLAAGAGRRGWGWRGWSCVAGGASRGLRRAAAVPARRGCRDRQRGSSAPGPGAGRAAAGARHHACVLGHRVPDQPASSRCRRWRVRVAVYTGSSPGPDAHVRAAAEFAAELARAGAGIVYGGSQSGLMGIVADAALAAGGEVIGVIPRHMLDNEVPHQRLTRLEIVASMHERKARMAELADAFITLPGGVGTMEELFETWTWGILGLHAKPVALLDADGFYRPLIAQLEAMTSAGYLKPAYAQSLGLVSGAQEFLSFAATYQAPRRTRAGAQADLAGAEPGAAQDVVS